MTLGICLGCLILGFFIVFCKVTISNDWGILDIIFGPATYTGQFMPSVKWSIACGILISVIIAIYVLISDSKDINLENKRIIQNVKETNRKIDNNNLKKQQKAKMAIKQYNVFKQEATIISNQYDKIYHLLDKYYSLNVVYPKYRKMVYMCQIYEYLASGRCETLTGPYGAYNMLENDIKYNIIIEKLDNIISKLDSIIENQRELYNAIQECNRSVNNLHNTLQSIAADYENTSQSISDRLNTIEYNTRITAQCTQYTALYNYFKN